MMSFASCFGGGATGACGDGITLTVAGGGSGVFVMMLLDVRIGGFGGGGALRIGGFGGGGDGGGWITGVHDGSAAHEQGSALMAAE